MKSNDYGKAQIKLRGTKQQLTECIKDMLVPMDWCDNELGYEVKEHDNYIEFNLQQKCIQASKNTKSYDRFFRRWVIKDLCVSYFYFNSFYFKETDKENEFMVTIDCFLEYEQDFIEDLEYFSKKYGLLVRFFVCYAKDNILRSLEIRHGSVVLDENKTIKQVRWEYPFFVL